MLQGTLHAMTPPGGAQGGAGGFDFSFLLVMALVFGIMYFLMIRPQQKRQKEHQAMLNSLKNGDKVLTSSGIHGKIISVEETAYVIQIADNVNVKIEKAAVATKKD